MLFTDERAVPPKMLSKLLVHVYSEDGGLCKALSTLFFLEGLQSAFAFARTEFSRICRENVPDIAVIDLDVDDALDVVQDISTRSRLTKVVGIAGADALRTTVKAMRAGTSDVLSKPVDGEDLMQSIRKLLRENMHIMHLPDGRQIVVSEGLRSLTPRERDVLKAIVDGNSNKLTGQALAISPRTVEVHRARIMGKLGARNTADLIRIVLSR